MLMISSAGTQLAAFSPNDLACTSDGYGDWIVTLPLHGQVGCSVGLDAVSIG